MLHQSILFLTSYLAGAIPTGLLLARKFGGIDVRSAGSGNIGATNVYRTAGKGLGAATLVLDCLKGLLPVLAALLLGFSRETAALAGALAVIGHCFPIYLGFRGGKGVATALGFFIGVAPLAVLIALGVFLAVVARWRYISLGSILAAVVLPPVAALTGAGAAVVGISCVISVLVIVKHRENIRRLRAGTENRFRG
ncbi:MAG TPA: glycerol-3-phosphate 1-O-acyltransferase PlsY [Verrucomicrobiae bacterium]|nr:glycerol-3-phosphate 1-O-acyltransferase PlsY [Verrucomicrobiae bacterium]